MSLLLQGPSHHREPRDHLPRGAPTEGAPLLAAPYQGFLARSVLGQLEQLAARRPASSPSLLAPAAANQLYATSLGAAATVISHSNADETVGRRLCIGLEFQTWLGTLPSSSGFPVTLQTSRPEELLVFMQGHFILAHAGSTVPGLGHRVASPQGVSCALSHLSTLFEGLGRRGPYDPVHGTGNPCDCDEITRYKRGYRRDMWEAGYQESSAVPLGHPQLVALVRHLDLREPGSPFGQLLHERDGCLVLYSWASAMRGKEGGRLCLLDFFRADRRTPLFPGGVYSPGQPVPSEVWVLPTHGTKTNKRGRVHQDPVHLKSHLDPQLCFPTRLWAHLDHCLALGHGATHFVFRPQTAVRGHFKEAPFSSSSFNKLVQDQLGRMGQFSGETAHSFRRGTLQHTAATEGVLAAAVQGRIKTPAILERYLDPNRHLGRLRP